MRTPREQFDDEVTPTCEEYFADATSERRAKAAAQALDNLVEWTFQYYARNDPSKLSGKNLTEFRRMHAAACPEYKIVWDVADAAKHRFLTRNVQFRVVTTSTGGWADAGDTLEIKDIGDNFDEVIGAAMDYWDGQI